MKSTFAVSALSVILFQALCQGIPLDLNTREKDDVSNWWARWTQQITGNVVLTPNLAAVIAAAPKEQLHYLTFNAVGTQNYICAPKGADMAWQLNNPDAELFVKRLSSPKASNPPVSVGRHNFHKKIAGPPFWTLTTKDGSSTIYVSRVNSDPSPAGSANIPWLALNVTAPPVDSVQATATPINALSHQIYLKTTYVLRVATEKGQTPTTACTSTNKDEVFPVEYKADYWLYVNKDAASLNDLKHAVKQIVEGEEGDDDHDDHDGDD